MIKFIAVIIAGLGATLILYGMKASDSISSDMSRMFTGSPTDKTMWLMMAGILATATGIGLFFSRVSRP